MAAVEENKPAQPGAGTPGSAPAAKGKAPSQGDNPDNRYDSEGVTPVGLESVESDVPPAPGGDPDSLTRSAKAMAADPHGDNDQADEQLGRAAKARRLIAERNQADAGRVEAIDAELEGLGFTAPVATTEVQRRGDDGPVGRNSGRKAEA